MRLAGSTAQHKKIILVFPMQLTTLELQYVSPNLLNCEDLELAVPGTYEPNQPIIHIKKVSPSLNVITSKQRPRKLVIQGQQNNIHNACMHLHCFGIPPTFFPCTFSVLHWCYLSRIFCIKF